MACVPVDLMILVILNLILRYVRPSEADIEDCGMRKRAWPLAQIAQHKKNLRAFFVYIHPYPPTNEFIDFNTILQVLNTFSP